MKQELALCTRYTEKGASSRLRFFACIPALEEAGFSVRRDTFYSTDYLEKLYRTGRRSPFDFASALAGRILRAGGLPEHLFIEYELFPYLPYRFEASFLRRRKYVLNFDDDIFLRYGREPNKLDRLCARASGVICANDLLLERVKKYQPNVLKAPTVVDLKHYHAAIPAERTPREKPLAVWIGTPVTYKFLEQAAPQLRAMYETRPYELRVIASAKLPPIAGLDMEFFDWSCENEAKLLAESDFGIMPLPADDAFAAGKSAYKIIQYFACGLPVIASPVGENSIVVTPECGILADTPEEWAAAIAKISAPDLRQGALRRGEDFDLALWAPRIAEFLKKVFRTDG